MCQHSFFTHNLTGKPVKVPCGSCITCQRSARTFFCHRIQHDVATLAKQGIGSSFVSFTFRDDTLSDRSVHKRDLQLMHKRFRKSGISFKYLAIGDYGDNTKRKHYHGLYIGLDMAPARALCDKYWPFGFCDVEPIVSANISYVVRYMQGQTPAYIKQYTDEGFEPPFTLYSNGLGLTLFNAQSDNIKTTGRYFYRGKWYSVPPYWLSKYGRLKVPADMSEATRLAKRYGFADTQKYLEWQSRTAELVATREYRNRLNPPQGIRNVYRPERPARMNVKPIDIDILFKED